MLLTREQIQALTGYKMPYAQIRALRKMKVPFLVRPDGKPVVCESALVEKRTRTEPNLDAL